MQRTGGFIQSNTSGVASSGAQPALYASYSAVRNLLDAHLAPFAQPKCRLGRSNASAPGFRKERGKTTVRSATIYWLRPSGNRTMRPEKIGTSVNPVESNAIT